MKQIFTIILSLIIISSIAQKEHSNWKSDIIIGHDVSISTILKVNKTNNQYVITSPKNADIRLFGGFNAYLGRLLGKSPKKGILLTINAKQTGDSIIGDVKSYLTGDLQFKGIINEHTLSGELVQNDSIKFGTLTSVRSEENSMSYNYLFPEILKITNDNIFSTEILQTKEWRSFEKKLKKLTAKAKDDIELYAGFSLLSPKLPFSHYYLIIKENLEEKENDELVELVEIAPTVFFEEKNKNTGYLKIENFDSSTEELAITLPKIIEKGYKNLIIDLRDNGGGGIEAAFEFANHIVNESTTVGYFVTNKLESSGFNLKLFETLAEAIPETTEEFIATLKNSKGAKLVFSKTSNPIFEGNLYILTNNATASTCEPIVHLLKTSNKAIIIGEKTAGAMLSGTLFDISRKYKLFLPIADFYTYDGIRIESVGVTPNIETTSEDALEKALSLIKGE